MKGREFVDEGQGIVDLGEERRKRRSPGQGRGQGGQGGQSGSRGRIGFRKEACVRRAFRESFRERVFWIEAGRGGTVGLPDAFLGSKEGVVFVELKIGEIRDGILRFTLRREQRQALRRMRREGIAAVVAVGVKGTRNVYFLPCGDATYTGRFPILGLEMEGYATFNGSLCNSSRGEGTHAEGMGWSVLRSSLGGCAREKSRVTSR